MRIVHVIDYFQPKMGYQETFVARAHARLGHSVDVVTSDRYSPHPQYESTWQPVLGPRILQPGLDWDGAVRIHRLPSRCERGGRIWLDNLEGTVADLSPDLLIVHGMGSFTAVRILLLRNRMAPGTKLVFDSHANEVNSTHALRQFFYAAYRVVLTPLFLSRADALVAIDESSKRFLEHECAIPAARITVIPLGADIDLFRPDAAQRASLRGEWGVHTDDVVAVYAGKLQRRKGVHLLVAAALGLADVYPQLKIALVGGGDADYIDEMKTAIAARGMQDRFFWTGVVPNASLYRYYSAADISVWPLQVSIGTLEAQACGLPLIVADEPVLRDRVSAATGLLCAPGRIDDLAARLRDLIDNPGRRRAMGLAGRQHVVDEFSWQAIASQFIALAD